MKTQGKWFQNGARLVLLLSLAVVITGCCKLKPNANCNTSESVSFKNVLSE